MKGQCGERIMFKNEEIHVMVYCTYNKKECRITSVKKYEDDTDVLQELSLSLIKDLEERMLGHAQD